MNQKFKRFHNEASAVAIHETLVSENPFADLSKILCSDTEEEVLAMAQVRARIGDERLARAYTAYVTDFPKGTLADFQLLDAETRRKYMEVI
jgi:hypothetical protein